jgi:hypothetical protein
MIELPLDTMYDEAQRRADACPALRQSMRGQAGNEVGAMGEVMAMRYLSAIGVEYRDDSQINHDLVTAYGTMDIKTKERTVPPLPHYDCTVPDYNSAVQRPDFYLFVSLQSDGSIGCRRFVKGWILGSISRERFYRIARVWKPSQIDDTNGWSATILCRNVSVQELSRPKKIYFI